MLHQAELQLPYFSCGSRIRTYVIRLMRPGWNLSRPPRNLFQKRDFGFSLIRPIYERANTSFTDHIIESLIWIINVQTQHLASLPNGVSASLFTFFVTIKGFEPFLPYSILLGRASLIHYIVPWCDLSKN